MKKRLIALSLAAFVLSGCDSAVTIYGYKMNQVELGVMTTFSQQESDVIKSIVGSGAVKRWLGYIPNSVEIRNNIESKVMPEGFFCESYDAFKASEYTLQRVRMDRKESWKTPGELYQTIYGKSVAQSCGVDKDSKTLVSQDVSKVDGKASVETLRNLASAIKECGRAKFDVLAKTSDLQSLTQAQAEEIIVRCELHKIEQELNK